MTENKMLVPLIQRTVEFYGDQLIAIKADDGHVYVAVRHLCEALGLDRASQVRRIKNSEILADGYKRGVKITSPGGSQNAGMLRVEFGADVANWHSSQSGTARATKSPKTVSKRGGKSTMGSVSRG